MHLRRENTRSSLTKWDYVRSQHEITRNFPKFENHMTRFYKQNKEEITAAMTKMLTYKKPRNCVIFNKRQTVPEATYPTCGPRWETRWAGRLRPGQADAFGLVGKWKALEAFNRGIWGTDYRRRRRTEGGSKGTAGQNERPTAISQYHSLSLQIHVEHLLCAAALG